jgi:PAS domain S-box-containing protein
MKAPLPLDEPARLAALHQYDILDTAPEQSFDDLTLLVAHICAVPSAMVSLVDDKRQWFKSRLGRVETETSRDIAFCAHTILHADDVFEVRDARADLRFADNPMVTGPEQLRFYAGAPLVAPSGHVLGALCVTDTVPRRLSADQLAALRALSRHVVSLLEQRRQSSELKGEVAERRRTEELLQRQFERLQAGAAQANRLLALAEKSRRALLGVLEDEKRSGSELRASEERFRQLADNIHEVFWMTDPATSTLLYVSPGYERIWGRTCQSLYRDPSNWIGAIHPEDRARIGEAAVNRQAKGEYDETYRIVRPDGEVRWIRDRAFPVLSALGDIYRMVGTATDITAQRRLEEQVRQAQKMDAIGTLAGGIAHDFNNILAAINGYTELAEMSVKEQPQVCRHLAAVRQAAARAADLVGQILMFSRQQPLKRKPIRLLPVVAEACNLLRATIPSTIEFDLSLAADAPAVLADATQIHQILMNLGTNGWHAMKDRPGRLEVTLERLPVDAALAATVPRLQPGLYARVSIRDTGDGMSPAILRRIFEPFFTTKGLGEGTGLGLAVVHGILDTHEGAIGVESVVGAGTVFRVYLPAYIGEVSEVGAETGEVPRGHGERILVVDDEQLLAEMGRETLGSLGYEAESTTKPEVALAWVRDDPHRFALVVTDHTMPGMTGLHLATQLRQIKPRLPIILMTGNAAALTSEQTEAAGVGPILLKPASVRALGTAVQAALRPAPPV